MTKKITGYAALEQGAALVPFSYDPLPLKANEVRIDITHCGLCGTDVQGIDNYYGIVDYPFVPGHEIVGHISEVGSAVSPSRLGQRVGVGWQGRACGHCEWCDKGDVHLCMDVADNGSWTPYGGFSTSVAVEEGFAYPLPEGMSSEVAAVMMCAGITVFSALHKYYSAPGLRLGIVGIGGLGHLALQFARAMGYEVTALSSSPQKQAEALTMGAECFIAVSDEVSLGKVADYFDILYVTTHGGVAWEEMMGSLKRKGKLLLSGFPDLSLDSVDLVAHELCIEGSFLGTQQDMCDMLAFAQTHAIQPILEIYPMSQVNQAIEKLKHHEVRYRIVLLNDFG
jgi:uncharacterized zinc-type alcohol dehydrogenase-like protein